MPRLHRAAVACWFLLAAITVIAGCHGSSAPSLPKVSGQYGTPVRHPFSGTPVPEVSPETVCAVTATPDSNSHGGEHACWLLGDSPASDQSAGPVYADPNGKGFWCEAGTYSLVKESGGAQPHSPLSPPSVSFDPPTSQAGWCSKLDSTVVSFTFPSPIPTGSWDAPWGVMETETVCLQQDQNCTANQQFKIGEFWLHSGLRIADNDANQNEIEGTDWERVIGQRVNLAVLAPFNSFENLSNCNWNVPNADPSDAVGSYSSYSGSTPPTAVPSPSPVPALTNVLGIKFYWTQPFQKSQLNVTCTIRLRERARAVLFRQLNYRRSLTRMS